MIPSTVSNALPIALPTGLATSLWDALWFRENASDYAHRFNTLYAFVFWISLAFFAVLMLLMVWFMLRYRRQKGVPAVPSASHNTPLEILWSVIPAIGFGVMFFWGTWVYLPKTVVPDGALEINVTAKQWVWSLEYPNGATSLQNEWMSDKQLPLFAIPVDRPVKFLLSSDDVIHSFYLPEFRVKRDCFPNRYTVAWVEANEITHEWDSDRKLAVPIDKNGNGAIDTEEQGYHLFCAEYCGNEHSQMAHRIAVMSGPDFEAWVEAQNNTDSIPLLELGAKLYKSKGCASCHNVTEGARGTGPTWYGIWGDKRPGYKPMNPEDNPEGVVNFQYVRESILTPSAYYRPGYEGVNMSSFMGQLTDREIRALATYIKSLDPAFTSTAEEESAAELEAQQEAAEGGGDSEEPGV